MTAVASKTQTWSFESHLRLKDKKNDSCFMEGEKGHTGSVRSPTLDG